MLVIGSGLMGPAAAHNALSDPDGTHVGICGRDREQLDSPASRSRVEIKSMCPELAPG